MISMQFKTWLRLHEDDSMPNNNEKRKEMTIDSPAHFIMNPEGVVIRTNLRHARLSDEELEKVLKKNGLSVTHHIDDFKRVGSFNAQYDKKNKRRTASVRYTTLKKSDVTPKNKNLEHYDAEKPSQRLSAQQQNERSVLYFQKLFRSNAEFTSSTKPNMTGKIKADCTLSGGKCLGENDGKNDIDIEIKPYARQDRSVHEHSRVHRHDAVINGSGGISEDLKVHEYLDMLKVRTTKKGNTVSSDTYPSWKLFQHITKNFPGQYFQSYKFTGTPTEQEEKFKRVFSKPKHKHVYKNQIRTWWDPAFKEKVFKPRKSKTLSPQQMVKGAGKIARKTTTQEFKKLK